jgi:glycyl-tRNA synthetase beta chain
VSDFLLEIGVENLPASYVDPAAAQLQGDMEALCADARIDHGDIYVTSTPRRLVVIVSDMAERQSAAEDLVTGPPVSRAFDENGKPTKAAEGFARSQGVKPSALEHVTTDKGEYLGVRRRLPRRKTTAVLRDSLPEMVAGLRFPKTMKWEASGARFARPVRWIVALYGSAVVRFRFADVTSGNRTWRRPWIRGESAVVRSAGTWHKTMIRLGVVFDRDERCRRLVELAGRAAKKEGLRLVEDEALVEELTQMCEDPRVIVGSFDDRYLALPPEVVTTAMRSHQRYIALRRSRGRLAPRFITFTDGRVSSPSTVRRGNEKVLHARLEDASFYWREDVTRGVDGLAAELDRIVFIEGLGSIGDKARRMERIAVDVNARLRSIESAPEPHVRRAAQIAKADLASEMIKDGKEFTKLQGVIGAYYAKECGEEAAVSDAVREHYMPRTPGERCPQSPVGVALGVADRMDTICGCFLAGLKPTGSQDPYALRRGANGILRMVDKEPRVTLDTLVSIGVEGYRDVDGIDDDAIKTAQVEVGEFMRARVAAYLKEGGAEYDAADAVIAVSWMRPGVALAHARDIAKHRGDERFERLITGVKRVGNILSPGHRRLGAEWSVIRAAFDGSASSELGFSPGRFEDDAEGALADAVREALPGLESAQRDGDFPGALDGLSALADPIDRYFDAVLVNAEDAEIRANRHRFLACVYAVFGRFADFSHIVERGGEEGKP